VRREREKRDKTREKRGERERERRERGGAAFHSNGYNGPFAVPLGPPPPTESHK
jgi:hypothetical protein